MKRRMQRLFVSHHRQIKRSLDPKIAGGSPFVLMRRKKKRNRRYEKGDMLSKMGSTVKRRLEAFTASDLTSIVGRDKEFLAYESKIVKAVF